MSDLRSTPRRLVRAGAGLVAAGVALASSALVAAVIAPAAAPLLVIGGAAVDAAPTPAKEFAVRTFGTADKLVLIGGVAVVLLAAAAGLGLLAWRHRRWAVGGVVALGGFAAVVAVLRPGATWLTPLPSLVAAVAGAATLLWLSRTPPADLDPRTAAAATRSRRRLIGEIGLGGAVTVVAGAGAVGVGAVRDSASRGPGVALPTPSSPAVAPPAGAQIAGGVPFVTPSADFYRVDISLTTPRYDPAQWELRLDGMVERPITLSYRELLDLPMVERYLTLTCVSNEVGGPYVSTGRWLGVRFSDLIDLVRPRTGVDQLFSYSLDSGYTCSTPYSALQATPDAMVAVGLNGERLPDRNGFPARMIVPGLFGFVSGTKWLSRLEFTTYAERTAYWTERGWATDAPILTQCRIDVPMSLSTLPTDKPVLAGIAWAQGRGISRVEIQIDDLPWADCVLAEDAGVNLWRQWSYQFSGAAGQHRARVRATDGTGRTQPEARRKVFPAGATGWHEIVFAAL